MILEAEIITPCLQKSLVHGWCICYAFIFPIVLPWIFLSLQFQLRLHCRLWHHFAAFSWEKSSPSHYEANSLIFMPVFTCFPLSMKESFSYFCHVRAYSQEYQDFCDYKKGKIILVFTWIWLWRINISSKWQNIWGLNF